MELAEILELAGVGLLAGTWGSLIGAGGGFIIVPVLLLMNQSLSAATVSAVSLVAVWVNGLSGSLVYARSQRIDYKTGSLFLLATMPGGVLGALTVNRLNRGLFQTILGALLCAVAVYLITKPGNLLTQKRERATGQPRRIVDARGQVFEYRVHRGVGLSMTFVVGFLASMLGVGGGIFNVPTFAIVLGIPIEIAAATSHFMVMGTSLIASITNLVQGDLWGLGALATSLAAGTLVGGQLGPRISYRYGSRWLSLALSIGLLVVGVRLLWNGWRAL